jgi:hypothetical protein
MENGGRRRFAVDWTRWWEPLRVQVSGPATAVATAAVIAANFRRLIGVYLAATADPLVN